MIVIRNKLLITRTRNQLKFFWISLIGESHFLSDVSKCIKKSLTIGQWKNWKRQNSTTIVGKWRFIKFEDDPNSCEKFKSCWSTRDSWRWYISFCLERSCRLKYKWLKCGSYKNVWKYFINDNSNINSFISYIAKYFLEYNEFFSYGEYEIILLCNFNRPWCSYQIISFWNDIQIWYFVILLK